MTTAIVVIGIITVWSNVRKKIPVIDVIETGSAQDVFIMNCAMCHGKDGGGTTQAKGLRGRALDREYVKKMIQSGNTLMPRFHFIHDPDLTDLADYVHKLK